jgi:hypothetical protein
MKSEDAFPTLENNFGDDDEDDISETEEAQNQN